MSWLEVTRHWGSTEEERQRPFPCDEILPDYNHALFRAVSVSASTTTTYRWLCQLRIAPYSYDWIDNFGRRSPQTLTPGLYELELGQRFMSIFDLAAFEQDEHITLRLRRPGLFPPLAVSYVVAPHQRGCRLLVKLAFRLPSGPIRGILGSLGASIGAAGDWVMMRRQLLNLRDLAEGEDRQASS